MRLFFLLSTLITISSTLSLPTTPSLTLPPSLSTIPRLTNGQWQDPPFRFPLSTSLHLYMTINAYSGRGPATPTATALLKRLANNLDSRGAWTDKIRNHTESLAGVQATFSVKPGEPGITRLQAKGVLFRLWGLTIVKDAVGIRESDIELEKRVVGHFTLEWMYEGRSTS